MANELIYKSDARRAIVKADPYVSFCIDNIKPVDAVEVEDKELLKAIKMLIKQYSHSKNSDYVRSPVAHALYHTWKQVDAKMDLPQITEQTKDALMKMGDNAHGEGE